MSQLLVLELMSPVLVQIHNTQLKSINIEINWNCIYNKARFRWSCLYLYSSLQVSFFFLQILVSGKLKIFELELFLIFTNRVSLKTWKLSDDFNIVIEVWNNLRHWFVIRLFHAHFRNNYQKVLAFPNFGLPFFAL